MLREIKFRAWYYDKDWPEYSYMTFVCSIDFVKRKAKIGVLEQICKFDQIELMQYTGLKDKNGVEIYEGDIVRCHDLIITIEERIDLLSLGTRDYEVIGNIYKNKELIL